MRGTRLEYARGGRSILRDVSIELIPGEISVVLGPNGAGKTSLLRILSGELKPDSGSVTLNGRDLASLPVRELGQTRAFLQQQTHLDFAFTVMEVVLLGRSPFMTGGERPKDYEAAEKALQQVDLSDRAHDSYTTLSGGEKQRVHLARTLAQMDHPEADLPRYLFLDEPNNNLDLAHQEMVVRAARELAQSRIAVCMVLHDINQAFQIGDVVHIMEAGRIALSGTPGQLAPSPEIDRIFKVSLNRIPAPERACPLLVASS
jgi:iron complex transport system ATP-binding protein